MSRRYQLLLFATLFQVMIGFGIVMPILPFFARELGGNSLQMGLMVTVWAGGQFLFAPLWGGLSDRIGRRPVLLIGLFTYVLVFILMAMARSIWGLIAIRALGGILSAATIPAAQAYVADVTEGAERSRQMANMGAAMNLGFFTGPFVGALLTPLGFRAAFYAAAALALITLVAAYVALPEPPHRQAAAGPRMNGLRAAGLALRGPEALFFLLAFATTYGGSTMFSMLGFYLIDRFQATPLATEMAFILDGAVSAAVQGLVVARLAQSIGEERTIRMALALGAAGFLALILAPRLWLALGSLALIAAATSLLRPTIAALVSRRTRLEQGLTMGMQSAFDALGRSVAPFVAGAAYLVAHWLPFAGAMRFTWSFWSGVALSLPGTRQRLPLTDGAARQLVGGGKAAPPPESGMVPGA